MAGTKRHVLIVDDDADFIETIRPTLQSAGYDVGIAHNGQECLESVRAQVPDLILLDIMMSTWSEGFDVAEQLEEAYPGGEIPVVLVSSIDLTSPLEPPPGLASRLPAAGCMVKPVKPDDLLARIESTLKRKAQRIAPAAETADNRERPVILLVDDDPDFLTMTSAVLEANGYTVIKAMDGATAREKVEEQRPNLIITDLMMESVLAGFMFSQEIKQSPRLQDIPVIFVTAIRTKRGFHFDPKERELAGAGIDGYFEKPVNPDELLSKVSELLAGTSGRSARR
jgi:CheY-like chemotaxis protein